MSTINTCGLCGSSFGAGTFHSCGPPPRPMPGSPWCIVEGCNKTALWCEDHGEEKGQLAIERDLYREECLTRGKELEHIRELYCRIKDDHDQLEKEWEESQAGLAELAMQRTMLQAKLAVAESHPTPSVTRAQAVEAAGREICNAPVKTITDYYATLHPNSQAVWRSQGEVAVTALEALGVVKLAEEE